MVRVRKRPIVMEVELITEAGTIYIERETSIPAEIGDVRVRHPQTKKSHVIPWEDFEKVYYPIDADGHNFFRLGREINGEDGK